MTDVEKLMMYDDEEKQNSMTFFIISLSSYLNEISLEKSSFEKRILFKKTFFSSIASALMKVIKKTKFFKNNSNSFFATKTIEL